MLLKNRTARLITIRTLSGENYKILPGNNPDVEVPRDACQSDFVKGLIANDYLTVTSDEEPEVESEFEVEIELEVESEYAHMSKADLQALCEAKGIEFVKRDTADDLIAKLDAVE